VNHAHPKNMEKKKRHVYFWEEEGGGKLSDSFKSLQNEVKKKGPFEKGRRVNGHDLNSKRGNVSASRGDHIVVWREGHRHHRPSVLNRPMESERREVGKTFWVKRCEWKTETVKRKRATTY